MFFYVGLFLLCASILAYEIVLTRLLSVVSWYYLAFVSVSMAMFGMTAGALVVQLRPRLFTEANTPRRLAQVVFLMAVSMPLSLLNMLAIPVELSRAVQTLYSFLLLVVVISAPFFFAGVAVCLSLTRVQLPIGRIYFVDLVGASTGCLLAIALLKMLDAPSAIFALSALLFISASAYYVFAGDRHLATRSSLCAFALIVVAGLNASTLYGIQPIWSKGQVDRRDGLLAEIWNPISKVRAVAPEVKRPQMWGPSPKTPVVMVEEISVDIDNDAQTPMTRYRGKLDEFDYLRYDVSSVASQLRQGSAAVIGVGGGRDLLTCAVSGFHRIVGIEVNSAVLDLSTRRFDWFTGLSRIPGIEIHEDEGRSYLTRSGEKFDLIQASLVDTWAATSAGAMTLSENALYTVDGWQVFFQHLKPRGVITFSRWYSGYADVGQTSRLFAVAWAMLLKQGVTDPGGHLAYFQSGRIATLLASKDPFSSDDLEKIKSLARDREFNLLFTPGEVPESAELRNIAASRRLEDLAELRTATGISYAPVYDSSPYFFNAVRLKDVPTFLRSGFGGGNLKAILYLGAFTLAAAIMIAVTILLPAWRWSRSNVERVNPRPGGIVYFVSIGLGFMLVEMAMIQQLSVFLGHPIYSLVVVLAGIILASGLGSLCSDRLGLGSSVQARLPALAVALSVFGYTLLVLPAIHQFTASVLWQRVAISLLLIVPCGFFMGFCFPVGMRWLTHLKQEQNLPWMWALNGAAGTLGSFVAILISMDSSIATCALTGAALYVIAGVSVPGTHSTVASTDRVAEAVSM